MEYDLVVRNGLVIDGTGLPRVRADVAVRDGIIARVGTVREPGATEIDADGHVVTPGFVDGHTHMDAQIHWDPLGRCSVYHGVTTAIMGSCGFTLAPASEDQRDLVVRNLERAEDISPAAMRVGIPDWKWSTFAEHLDVVEALPMGINYAANIGHSALRTFVMGERAFDGEATDDDVLAMVRELAAALRAGAAGFTTSRSIHHLTSDDRPVASRLASWEELRRLVGVVGELGGGVFQLAMGEDVRDADPAVRHRALQKFKNLAVDSGAPITFNVFPTSASGDDWREQLALFDETAAAGGKMFGQTSSRGVSSMLSFETQTPFDKLPEWKELRARPLAEQVAILRDPVARRHFADLAEHSGAGASVGAEARKPDFHRLFVMTGPLPPYPTVAEIATARGIGNVEAMIEIALERDLVQFFIQPLSFATPEFLLGSMKHPRTVMTFSDSGAHVSQVMDSSIQTHLLAYWVREQQAFSLEEGVRMISLAPATAWGLADRGLVREGMAADLNVFDPDTVGPRMPVVVADLPGGAKRLDQRSEGFLATIVNGEVLLRDGEPTGALPGRLWRGPLARL